MNFSDNLKKIRKENNLSQEQIAEQLGVSRQSVSKWESGQAYPEMDKMIQLCQIFNLNIDDLLNQDIKEVNNNKQSRSNINKFVDDFLDYITKTIDMFSSMKFKQKIKCLFEQAIIIGAITLVLLIIGSILSIVLSSLLSFLPYNIMNPIFNVFEALYLVFCLILGVVLLLHIFKVRYLDYCVIEKENSSEYAKDDNLEITKESGKQKIFFRKNVEKIVIRDPEHSGYKFINTLLKILLFMIKVMVSFIALFFCLSLVVLVISLIISFVFIKTGVLFFGVELGIVSSIIINYIVLNMLYNFIVSRKIVKTKLAISFFGALVLFGVGVGFSLIGITKFDVVDNMSSEYYNEYEERIEMKNDLLLFGDVEYVESDNKDLRVVTNTSEFYDIYMENHDNSYYFHYYNSTENLMKYIRQQIKDINNRKIINYSNYEIKVYTTKENINTLEKNIKKYEQEEIGYQNVINEYERKIDELNFQLKEKENKINELNDKLCLIDESNCD